MAEEQQNEAQEKTEQPSERKLKKAREKGQIPLSKEVSNWFAIIGIAILIGGIMPYFAQGVGGYLKQMLTEAPVIGINMGNLRQVVLSNMLPIVGMFLGVAAVFAVLAVSGVALQTKLNISTERMKPKLEKLSLLKGAKKLFSMASVVEMLKATLKLTLIGVIIYLIIKEQLPSARGLVNATLTLSIQTSLSMLGKLVMAAGIFVSIVAAADYGYQYYTFMKKMKMSKQEVKEEHKETEGNPHVKSKRRSRMQEISSNRMMAEVPKSTVIVTNPTHYSLAMKYDETMNAPQLVAKGKDEVALKIRELAKKAKVPLVENKPLARAMYKQMKIGDEIPEEFYKPMAEIIRYVQNMKRWQ